MTNTSIAKASLHLIAGCCVALLMAAGDGVAFAHGGGGHNGGNHNGNSEQDSGSVWSQRHHANDHRNYGSQQPSNNMSFDEERRHHRHHHHKLTSARPPLHGSGSSHNPIIYHPPVKPIVGVNKPVFGPAKPKPSPTRSPPPINYGSSGCLPNHHGGHVCPTSPGPTITDHRNGKTCSYIYGNWNSWRQYLTCEGS